MFHMLRTQDGIGVLDLVVSLAISAVLSSLIGMSVSSIARSSNEISAHLEANQGLQMAAHWLAHDVAQSSEITVNGLGDGLYVAFVEGKVPATCEYLLLGSQLVRRCEGQDTVLSRNVAEVSFFKSNALIRVTLTVQPSERVSRSRTVFVRMRNG